MQRGGLYTCNQPRSRTKGPGWYIIIKKKFIIKINFKVQTSIQCSVLNWKRLALPGGAENELAESEVAKGEIWGWGGGNIHFSLAFSSPHP